MIKNHHCLFFLLGVLSILQVSCVAAKKPHPDNPPDPIAQAATAIATGIQDKVSLSGMRIQLVPENITEQETGLVPAFSGVLCETLTTALSAHGAVIVAEAGEHNPYLLTATFLQHQGKVRITARLHRIDLSGGKDLASAGADIPISAVQQRWLAADLRSVANVLVHKLELQYAGNVDFHVKIQSVTPGSSRQPTLYLAQELRKQLGIAVKESKFFGSSVTAQHNYPLAVQYVVVNNQITFTAVLHSATGKLLAKVSTTAPEDDFAPQLLKPTDYQGVTTCVTYRADNHRSIQQGTTLAAAMVEAVTRQLTAMQIPVESCSAKNLVYRLQCSLDVESKRTRDGYQVAKVRGLVTPFTAAGTTLGSIVINDSRSYAYDREQTVRKILEDQGPTLEKQLAPILLSP